MPCHEFEIMCRWVAARLRARGMDVDERDPDFLDAVAALRLRGVADAVRLESEAVRRLASAVSTRVANTASSVRMRQSPRRGTPSAAA